MRDIKQVDLRLIDTTILLVFLGAMRHRQATAVAREMGLTQPAVSHALGEALDESDLIEVFDFRLAEEGGGSFHQHLLLR